MFLISMVSEFLNKKMNLGIALTILCLVLILESIFLIVVPWVRAMSFGGTSTFYNPVCVLDTPVVSPVTCAVSCPICTGVLGGGCAAVEEVVFTPMGGEGSFVCPPKGFPYMGGGPPAPGKSLMGFGGVSAPAVIGTSL